MGRHLLLVLIATTALGALCTPEPLQPSGNEPGPGIAYPPSGVNIGIRSVVVGDMNGDGRDDLFLANDPALAGAPDDALSRGVIVMLGRSSGFGSVYDAFVTTPQAAPYAIAVGELSGDTTPELVVLGAAENQTFLLVFDGAELPTFATTRQRELPFALFSSDWVFAAVGRFSTAFPTVVMGHATRAYTLDVTSYDPATFSGLGLVTLEGPNNGEFANAWAALPFPRGAINDLVIASEYSSSFYPSADDSLQTSTSVHPQHARTYFPQLVNVDAGASPEVLGYADLVLTALNPETGAPQYALEDLWGYTVKAMHAADLDGNGWPEVMALDREGDNFPTVFGMLENVYASGTALVTDTPERAYSFGSTFHPFFLTSGDFNGDAASDILAFDLQGAWKCLRGEVGLTPSLCAF